MLGGAEVEEGEEGGDGRSFFYQKWYVSSHTFCDLVTIVYHVLPSGTLYMQCCHDCVTIPHAFMHSTGMIQRRLGLRTHQTSPSSQLG